VDVAVGRAEIDNASLTGRYGSVIGDRQHRHRIV
jgi:hypothetical protein